MSKISNIRACDQITLFDDTTAFRRREPIVKGISDTSPFVCGQTDRISDNIIIILLTRPRTGITVKRNRNCRNYGDTYPFGSSFAGIIANKNFIVAQLWQGDRKACSIFYNNFRTILSDLDAIFADAHNGVPYDVSVLIAYVFRFENTRYGLLRDKRIIVLRCSDCLNRNDKSDTQPLQLAVFRGIRRHVP